MPDKMYRKTIVYFFLFCLLIGVAFAMSKAPKPATDISDLDFLLYDLKGEPHYLSDHKGKIIFLNFWATWCPPCRAEMPSMQKLQKYWNPEKYAMVAVNVGEDPEIVRAFMQDNNYTFPVLLDTTRKIARKYQVTGIPVTFIINEEGQIAAREVGAREWTNELLDSF
ncbi:MAG: TlpA disulfide reductase family protein [bacterium]